MARPATATSILALRGSFKTHPERKRPNEPEVTAPFTLDPPAHLSADAAACWREIAGIAPAGVLTAADVLVVEMLADLLAEYRRAPSEMSPSKLGHMRQMLRSLGLDPSGRASLVVPKKPDGGRFEGL
jgi:phage terminase small subunit